jgi:hypothetical protein
MVGSSRVCTTWVDECALSIVEAAVTRNRGVTLLYPAAAGQISTLLAAQVLIHRFLNQEQTQSVGLVTATPGEAVELWNDLAVIAPGNRALVAAVFPAWRAEPDGASPFGRNHFRGLMVGRRCSRWHADLTIVDNLAGPVSADTWGPTIRVTADPLEQGIDSNGQDNLVWGWSEALLKVGNATAPGHCTGTPFSVGPDRLEVLAAARDVAAVACEHPNAEKALSNLRDDLRTLASIIGKDAPHHLAVGLRVAWAHTSALTSLPCRPSQYDRFAGLPPVAARASSSFEPEISAWAATLRGDAREYGSVIASDLADLRAALEEDNPFHRALLSMAEDDEGTLVVVRNRTAAKAFLASVGASPDERRYRNLVFASYGDLHRQGVWSRVIVVGPPPRSGWHRIDSGLSLDLRILVLGKDECSRARWALADLRAARSRWAAPAVRDKVWRALVDSDPPVPPAYRMAEAPNVTVIAGPSFLTEPDPYSPLGHLLADDRPLMSDVDQAAQVAIQSPGGDWSGEVRAVRVQTDGGIVLLAAAAGVDVISGGRIETVAAETLKSGMHILVGRREGRVGLMEALDETFRRVRPDLAAAHVLVRDLRRRVQAAFAVFGRGFHHLFSWVAALGCDKDEQTVRSWVLQSGPMAPREVDDLRRLCKAVSLSVPDSELREVFQGVRRIRGFRISAGLALSRAAVAAAAMDDAVEIKELEREMGVSVADLRDAVLEVQVLEVTMLDEPVPVASIGRLS